MKQQQHIGRSVKCKNTVNFVICTFSFSSTDIMLNLSEKPLMFYSISAELVLPHIFKALHSQLLSAWSGNSHREGLLFCIVVIVTKNKHNQTLCNKFSLSILSHICLNYVVQWNSVIFLSSSHTDTNRFLSIEQNSICKKSPFLLYFSFELHIFTRVHEAMMQHLSFWNPVTFSVQDTHLDSSTYSW